MFMYKVNYFKLLCLRKSLSLKCGFPLFYMLDWFHPQSTHPWQISQAGQTIFPFEIACFSSQPFNFLSLYDMPYWNFGIFPEAVFTGEFGSEYVPRIQLERFSLLLLNVFEESMYILSHITYNLSLWYFKNLYSHSCMYEWTGLANESFVDHDDVSPHSYLWKLSWKKL